MSVVLVIAIGVTIVAVAVAVAVSCAMAVEEQINNASAAPRGTRILFINLCLSNSEHEHQNCPLAIGYEKFLFFRD
jgi:hypothetical protein